MTGHDGAGDATFSPSGGAAAPSVSYITAAFIGKTTKLSRVKDCKRASVTVHFSPRTGEQEISAVRPQTNESKGAAGQGRRRKHSKRTRTCQLLCPTITAYSYSE